MEEYERETGKFAIWRGTITEGFKKWIKGEKDYETNKERVTFLVSNGTKEKWQKIMKEQSFATISKLIRTSVDFYIENISKPDTNKVISKLSHDLKEPLTSIKGFLYLLIEKYKHKLEWEVLEKLKEIFDQSSNLESIISNSLDIFELKDDSQYDILIVDDDPSTNKFLKDFFKYKGYLCKDVISGAEALDELQRYLPRLILLDIILPDESGYDICKKIKQDDKLKKIPVFYITAVPENEVVKKLDETMVDGYFLKPFIYSDFELLDKYL